MLFSSVSLGSSGLTFRRLFTYLFFLFSMRCWFRTIWHWWWQVDWILWAIVYCLLESPSISCYGFSTHTFYLQTLYSYAVEPFGIGSFESKMYSLTLKNWFCKKIHFQVYFFILFLTSSIWAIDVAKTTQTLLFTAKHLKL